MFKEEKDVMQYLLETLLGAVSTNSFPTQGSNRSAEGKECNKFLLNCCNTNSPEDVFLQRFFLVPSMSFFLIKHDRVHPVGVYVARSFNFNCHISSQNPGL